MYRWLLGLRVAIRSVFHRTRVEAELDEELAYHLQREIEEARRAGLAPADAVHAARRGMGAIEKSKEESRDLRSGRVVGEIARDLRYAWRMLRHSPGFAVLAIAIMALGIGANTAVFSVVNGVLLEPLPYPGADRIVMLRTVFLETGRSQGLVSMGNFRDWRDQTSAFETMSTYRPGEYPATPGTTAEYTRMANVDEKFFEVFAVTPMLGRTFTPEETVAGSEHPVVVISHAYWQSRFGGAPDVLQRTLRVGTSARTIIGVMPRNFEFPGRTEVWTPQTTGVTNRQGHRFLAIGRMTPGVSLERAQSELTAVARRLEQSYPETNSGRGVLAVGMQDELVGDVRQTLYLLWGVVAVVLLIACANTATLLLGRASARTREVAVRAALGASRLRVVRQLVTESLLLALVAGAAGVALAHWGVRLLVSLAPADVVRLTDTAIDARVLSFTVAVAVVTSLLFGLVPALHAARVDVAEAIKRGGTRSVIGGTAARARGLLVVAEIAMTVVLLTGAGLLVKSLVALRTTDLGFQPGNVLVVKASGVRTDEENNAFFSRVMARIAALPGVTAVGATSVPPGDLSQAGTGAHFVDRYPDVRDRPSEAETLLTVVAPGSFDALGIPVRRGRDFAERDAADRPLVAIVNEALVRASFGGEDPIGRTIFCTFDRKDGMTIVGVVGDVRQRNPAVAPMPECYMPYGQHSYNNSTLSLVVRVAGDPMALAGPVRRAAAEISPDVPLAFTTMDEAVAKGVEDPSFRALLFGAFALVAVCLAMAGVYGVMAAAVQQRSKEIGLRIALGASRASVLGMILRNALVLTTIGLALGLAGAAVATRALETVLFQVRPIDIPVYAAVVALVGIITVAAAYLPVRRASSVDPATVLMTE